MTFKSEKPFLEEATGCVFKNFAKFTGKHLCWSLFCNKNAGLRPANFIKKDTPTQVLSSEFYEIFKNTYFVEHLPAATFALGVERIPGH